MVYKIYKSNNYIVIIDENDNYFEEHCANVLVTKLLTADATYNITFFRSENIPQAFYNVTFANIRQQSGAPYANVATWETWYTTNTGLCSNNVVLNSILATLQAQTEVEGVFVKDTGNSDKIVLQVKVWDQDSQTYIATYYYNPDGTLYTPVGPLQWVGTAGSVTANIVGPLGNTTTCADAVAVTYCAAQATEFFDQGTTLDSILTELQSTLDINITNSSLPVTQSGTWSVAVTSIPAITGTVALDTATLAALETITVNQGTSPWIISGTVALDTATLAALETINVVQSGTWTVAISSLPDITGTVALNAATLAALETVTVNQGTSPWVVSGSVNIGTMPEVEIKNDVANPIPVNGTVAATQSGTWNIGSVTGPVALPTGAATETTLAAVNTKLTPTTRTHNTVSATGAGSVPAGSLRGSVMNVGSAAGTWNGISIPAGVAIPWDAVGSRDTYGAIAYNATGTTLIIEYTT